MVKSIKENLKIVHERICSAAEKSGRNLNEITLVAVSKGQSLSRIEEARAAGLNVFGENRVQELLAKSDAIGDSVHWHLIGHLQTNKAAKVFERVELIQSVDSIHLIEKLAALAEIQGVPCRILLQVNTSGESSKSGFHPDEVANACNRIVNLDQLQLEGLMTIGPFTENIKSIIKSFADLRSLYEKLAEAASPGIRMNILSMGMSSDFEIAIQEGSNLLRIGTAIFGSRVQI
jgi:pyridoxal phosphate enzyme (YggS family)